MRFDIAQTTVAEVLQAPPSVCGLSCRRLLLLLLQISKLEVEAGGGLTCSAADNILSLL
jgi:hypothetical protein